MNKVYYSAVDESFYSVKYTDAEKQTSGNEKRTPLYNLIRLNCIKVIHESINVL